MVILKLADETFWTDPKDKTATALFDLLELYIKAPFAANVAPDHETSPISTNAVVPSVAGATIVKVTPPAEYPVPDTSLLVL